MLYKIVYIQVIEILCVVLHMLTRESILHEHRRIANRLKKGYCGVNECIMSGRINSRRQKGDVFCKCSVSCRTTSLFQYV